MVKHGLAGDLGEGIFQDLKGEKRKPITLKSSKLKAVRAIIKGQKSGTNFIVTFKMIW